MLVPQRAKTAFVAPMASAVDQIGHVCDFLGPVVAVGIALRGDAATLRNAADLIKYALR